MINMKLEKHTNPITGIKYLSLIVVDLKDARAEVLTVSGEATIEELVDSLRKLIDRLEFPRD